MMNPTVIAAIEDIFPFSEAEMKVVTDLMKPRSFKKNDVLLNEGELCQTIYLLDTGFLRSCYNNEGVGITLNFTFENQFTTSFMAYINREPSNIIISTMDTK